MFHLRLVHSAPSAPSEICALDVDAGATRVTAALLDAARLVPRQPEVVRARAIVRARAALATEGVLAVPAIRSRGLRMSVALIACAAFAIGAAGAVAAFHGRQSSSPTAPGALHSTPSPELAETGPAISALPAVVDPRPTRRGKRPRRI